ncbi:hypothetical protein HPB48_023292 [Haemaphysalis longicornis]|uniref:Transposable element P transposase-like RNase H C-terminal domain-containing protein n=1 Tax=Haemaphysalis longicornis TaxID=44386 RepID=A0A9J6H776_HAELO|nr:hypothetical protein HPB48_023292 [Haemaphysalis longicornis]
MRFLEGFLEYLQEWEQHAREKKKEKKFAEGGGFLTENTAVGLRVTITSTLGLLSYLTSTLGFRYLLTSRLSQDKLENLFGIIRQSSWSNDHPTVSQFLTTVNLLAFYNLAKTPRGGNCAPDVIKALLSPNELHEMTRTSLLDKMDDLLDHGNVGEADDVVQALVSSGDHASYTEKKSNSALIYYTTGYVARKIIAKNCCPQCAGCLCVSKAEASADTASYFTSHFDNGGLVYPSQNLSTAVKAMEDAFTTFFSKNELHETSLLEFSSELQTLLFPQLGCPKHEKEVLSTVVRFYVLLRFRFFVKGLNNEREGKRRRQKFLKMRRCQ